jgi:hypothetical protein
MKITYVRKQAPKETIKKLHIEDPKVRKKIHAVMKKYMEPYVPFRTGMLAVHKAEVHTDYVLYNVPYAKKLYHAKWMRINKSFHPLATDHWAEAMIKAKNKHYLNAVAKIIRKENE